MLPKTFCKKEGGDYERWNAGHVDMAAQALKVNPHNTTIFVNGVVVFGFYFETEPAKNDHSPGKGKKWNCKFGWSEKGML